MNKVHLLLLLIIVILSISSCSAIIRSEVMRPDTTAVYWAAIESGVYKFEYGNVSIMVYDIVLTEGKNYHGYGVAFGPPFIPIIPQFWGSSESFKKGPLIFRIGFDSPSNTTSIDFEKTRIQLLSGESLSPSLVKVFQAQEIPGKLAMKEVIMSNTKVTCWLTFDVSKSELSEFSIDLGHIQIDGEQIKLPPLTYRKTSDYRFVPLIISS